jgi:hypothetical protein
MTITEDLKPVAALMMGEIHAQIQRDARETMRLCEEFAKQVWSGGSQTKLPEGHWYMNPVGPYASLIVNSYRIAMRQITNPYHPGMNYPFRLFDALTADGCVGTWISNEKLAPLVHGARVEAILRSRDLEKYGWLLEKQKIDGKVHFRMVIIEA